MDIAGSIYFDLSISGLHLKQEFQVLNAKTYKHILLGRDFLSKFQTVEFDFAFHKVRLNGKWISCVQPTNNEQVRVQHAVTLPPRSENVVIVHCPKSKPLLTADFEPAPIRGISGVYATNCRIIPDLNGIFQISMLNVTNQPVSLYTRTRVGTQTSQQKNSIKSAQ